MAQQETRQAEAIDAAAERRAPRRTAAQMAIVGAIASVVGVVAGLLINWFPPTSSTQADKIDTLWDVLIIASVPVFVLVTTVIGFSILNFRMRPGEEGIDGPPIHGNTRLEVIWTAVPAILIVGLVTYAYIVLHDVEKAPAAGNERHVAVTGITTHYRITPKNPQGIGDHSIVCAELCGLGHAFMRSTVHVLSNPDFAKWVAKMTAAKPAGGGGGGGATLTAA